ncbi:MAG: TetR/AcrR family transcriptional regulator [Peptococcaceae bacterium]|nr:TetR/AcrR family transcriptional regulator [Peptococcaceae bacterium]
MDMREKILAGFRELAFTVGFRRATVDDLSARTGISKRTVYRYFRSKEEMISAVMEEIMAETGEMVDSALSSRENPVEKLTALVRVVSQQLGLINPLVLRDMQKHYPRVWNRIESFRAEKVRSIVEMLLAGNRQGYFRETIPEVFITALLAGIRDVINPGFILQHGLTVEKTIAAFFDIFLYGIVSGEEDKAGYKLSASDRG